MTDSLKGFWKELERFSGFAIDGLVDFYNFLEPLGSWVLGEGLPRFIESVTDGLSMIDWGNINESLQGLWDNLQPFAINVGEGLLWFWENVIVPLSTWVLNEALPLFLNAISGAFEVLNMVIEVLKPLWGFVWEYMFLPLAEWTGEYIINEIEFTVEAYKCLTDWIYESMVLIKIFIETLIASWNEICEKFVEFINSVWEFIVNFAKGIYEKITYVIEIFKMVISFLTNVFKKYWETVWNFICDIFVGIWEKIKECFIGIINKIIDAIDGLIYGVESALNFIIRGINDAFKYIQNIIDSIADLLIKVGINISINMPNIPFLDFGRIPRLASGAVLTTRTLFEGGEYPGARSNPEIVSPVSLMKSAFVDAMDERKNMLINEGVSSRQPIELSLDGNVFYRAMVEIKENRGIQINSMFAEAY